jgi:aurora kinase
MKELNNVKDRILPIPESVTKGLENEAKIQDFEILKVLGSGLHTKNVYLVRHKVTKAEYAIRVIEKKDVMYLKEKLIKEDIEVMFEINHPNIIKLYGHFEDNLYCYFIMEYSSRGNLCNLIPTDMKKMISSKICASIIKNVVSAVYYLHNMKPPILHKNIKLENVLIFKRIEGIEAKLEDWTRNYLKEDERRKDDFLGHNCYLPESMEKKEYNEASDIWCIGILLFKLMTNNEMPFDGKDIYELKDNIFNLKIRWPKSINIDAKDLITKILKIDPKERISLEDILKHPFITKYFPDAEKSLIKPEEGVKYKPFIVSKDDPKTWKPETME